MPGRKRITLPIIIMFLVAGAVLYSYINSLSIIPGPEGPEATIVGFNPWGTSDPNNIVTVGGSDGPFIAQGDTHNALFGYVNPNDYVVYYNLATSFAISRSLYAEVRIQPIEGPVKSETIEVEEGNGTKQVYWLEAYDYDLEVAVSPKKALVNYDGLYHYAAGENKNPWDIILAIGSVDLAPPSGAVEHRAKPLAAYVVSVNEQLPQERSEGESNAGECVPPTDDEIRNAIRTVVYSGSRIDMWTKPYEGKFTDYYKNIGNTYKQAIENLPNKAYMIITFPRISTAYKVNTWTTWFTPHWCVYYVFPVEVVKIRVWFIRYAEYQIPETSLPPEWTTKTPATGGEEDNNNNPSYPMPDFLGIPLWVWVLMGFGLLVILISVAAGGSKVVVVKSG